MAQHERPVTKLGAGALGPPDEGGVGRQGQVAWAADPALAARIGTSAQKQQRGGHGGPHFPRLFVGLTEPPGYPPRLLPPFPCPKTPARRTDPPRPSPS